MVCLHMKKHTKIIPTLPGFYAPKRGRKSRTPQQVFAARLASIKEKTFKQIGEIFSPFVPMAALRQEQAGAMSRRRIFTKENTFWAFLGQCLDSDGGCKEVVRKLQSYTSMRGLKMPSSSTASYCVRKWGHVLKNQFFLSHQRQPRGRPRQTNGIPRKPYQLTTKNH